MATALLVLMVAGTASRGVGAFSLGQLFPASRRGIRGSLLTSFANSKVPSASMKETMKQAIVKSQTKQEATKQSISSVKQEAVKQEVKQEAFKGNTKDTTKTKVKVRHKTVQLMPMSLFVQH